MKWASFPTFLQFIFQLFLRKKAWGALTKTSAKALALEMGVKAVHKELPANILKGYS